LKISIRCECSVLAYGDTTWTSSAVQSANRFLSYLPVFETGRRPFEWEFSSPFFHIPETGINSTPKLTQDLACEGVISNSTSFFFFLAALKWRLPISRRKNTRLTTPYLDGLSNVSIYHRKNFRHFPIELPA
jgi:hypothetical protein